MEKDFEYICQSINALSFIPVRLYKDNALIKTFSVIQLAHDPAYLYIDKLLSYTKNLSYVFFDETQLYGVVRSKNYCTIVGPTGIFLNDRHKMEQAAFMLNILSKQDITHFISQLSLIPNMPYQSFLQMLCTINFYFNNEKLSISDISIENLLQDNITQAIYKQQSNQILQTQDNTGAHNFLAYERTMLYYVEKGKYDELKLFFKESLPGSTGIVATNYLRNLKNTFVTAATLASRAAVRGGLGQEQAFSLSDDYIQRCEVLNTPDSIFNLQYHMVLDYTKRVNSLKNENFSETILNAISYIKNNLVNIMHIEQVADYVHVSQNYLNSLFKKETSFSIASYIQNQKIEESKRLLVYSDKPLSAISNYLGFSSQSHFQNVFKAYQNLTPKQFRSIKKAQL